METFLRTLNKQRKEEKMGPLIAGALEVDHAQQISF